LSTLLRPRCRSVVRAAISVGTGMDGAEMEDSLARSKRLKKARLRLAEAQGIIPAGSSERYQSTGGLKVRWGGRHPKAQ
jgi:hypothetical protein